jgi:hypothetical protein
MLVSLDDMKNYLGIPLIDTTYDTFLTEQLQLMSDTVEEYCNRKFETATYLQTFYREDFGTGEDKSLMLAQYPLKSVTTIEADGEAVTEYRAHLKSATLGKAIGFFQGADIVEVEYEAGYDVIPTPITSSIKSLVQERYNKKTSGVDLNFGSDVQSISIPGTVSVQFDYTLEANSRSRGFGVILGNYINVFDKYRSERTLGQGKLEYVEVVP